MQFIKEYLFPITTLFLMLFSNTYSYGLLDSSGQHSIQDQSNTSATPLDIEGIWQTESQDFYFNIKLSGKSINVYESKIPNGEIMRKVFYYER